MLPLPQELCEDMDCCTEASSVSLVRVGFHSARHWWDMDGAQEVRWLAIWIVAGVTWRVSILMVLCRQGNFILINVSRGLIGRGSAAHWSSTCRTFTAATTALVYGCHTTRASQLVVAEVNGTTTEGHNTPTNSALPSSAESVPLIQFTH